MRLDKFLTECGLGTRSEVKKLIDENAIRVNGTCKVSPKTSINEKEDIVLFEGEPISYKEFRYYVLNKKSGYVTAIEDYRDKTVMDLLPDWVVRKNLVPVGRLDKDTEGLLLFTNNGKLNHQLVSPKSHVDKTYYVETENIISQNDIKKLEEGIDIGGYVTLPGKVESLESKKILLTIREGKFHQVKKMLESVDNKVTYLRRISFGKLTLDDLELGEVKEVELEEII
ncbi:pseudouridine synthase [Fusobacterium sp. MFO224]|uniref:pseudouridine synthase n=1 Tax=Fusobacterium sp. MFO224 TaxID=3378070 RepID=UPI003852CB74